MIRELNTDMSVLVNIRNEVSLKEK